ncbi:hypothetical protein T492DRAFT_452958 [Pavlovales sp. CCMP2436]|nr:hypothetical protein T492DRAFT_452958 [Pavlovales sp. CCMP2436]
MAAVSQTRFRGLIARLCPLQVRGASLAAGASLATETAAAAAARTTAASVARLCPSRVLGPRPRARGLKREPQSMVRRRGLALLSCWVLGGGGSGAHILSAAASPARAVDLSKACVHFAECPGCSVATQLDQPPVLARARDFFRSECDVADVPSIMGPGTGWRTHAKLAVRGRAGAPLIGLFKARSHEVLQIPQCAVHHPAINSAVAELSALMAEARTSVYDEPSHTGLVRYLQVSVERSSGKVQLALVCNAPPVPAAAAAGSEVAGPVAPRGLLPLLALLAERAALPASVWHSVWVHFNEERRNNIVCYLPAPAGTSRWLLVSGPPAVRERVHKRVFAFPPFIFRQANLDAFEGIAREVAESVTEGSRVTELYAGIGLLGLNCAERVLSVRCSDVNPNLEDAQKYHNTHRSALRSSTSRPNCARGCTSRAWTRPRRWASSQAPMF